MNFKKFTLFFLLLLVSTLSFSLPIIEYRGQTNSEIGKVLSVLEDEKGILTFEDVRKYRFPKENNTPVVNLGISSSTFWLKFRVKNNSSANQLLLELTNPVLDEVEFYVVSLKYGLQHLKSGEEVSIKSRKYKHQNLLIDVKTYPGDTLTFFVKVRSGDQLLVPMNLGTVTDIFEMEMIHDLLSGLYFGLIIVMFFYNLFLYFTVRDSNYLYYVNYILFVGLTQACLLGYTYRFFWPGSPYLAKLSIFIVPALVGISVALFLRVFLKTKEHTPKLDKGLNVFIGGYILAILLALFNFYNLSYKIVDLIALVGSVYIFSVGYHISKTGYRPAKFFLWAWSIFLAGIIVFVLKDFNVLPHNNFTYHIMQIGSALEVILLSMALADKINILKREKEESQLQALNVLRENERIIKQQNIILETRVKERTSELEASNRELNRTFNHLKETQNQLINAEKMASLGQLTAGIAHEINNPINFVMSNITPLKRDINDIFELLAKYDEIKDENDFKEKQEQLKKLKEELDIDFLTQEVEMLLKAINEGAERTSEIVKAMRTFSRGEEVGYKKSNIHEAIDSSIVVLNNVLKGKIEVVKEYGNLPLVECNVSKLNQVFLNLINNAAQAITQKDSFKNDGLIIIKTALHEDSVEIRIKDNGVGIPPEVINKIYDPFFTTKDVGVGTGLGLSIVYNIIKHHNGEINVKSEPGLGAEFIITLPLIHVKPEALTTNSNAG